MLLHKHKRQTHPHTAVMGLIHWPSLYHPRKDTPWPHPQVRSSLLDKVDRPLDFPSHTHWLDTLCSVNVKEINEGWWVHHKLYCTLYEVGTTPQRLLVPKCVHSRQSMYASLLGTMVQLYKQSMSVLHGNCSMTACKETATIQYCQGWPKRSSPWSTLIQYSVMWFLQQ